MGYVEVIDKNDSKKVFVLVPRADWLRLQEELEDASDARAYKEGMAAYEASGRRHYPAEVAWRMMDGEHPVKVLREWRRMTQVQLAAKTGLLKAVISHIETGVRGGGFKTLGKIAAALDVPITTLKPRAAPLKNRRR